MSPFILCMYQFKFLKKTSCQVSKPPYVLESMQSSIYRTILWNEQLCNKLRSFSFFTHSKRESLMFCEFILQPVLVKQRTKSYCEWSCGLFLHYLSFYWVYCISIEYCFLFYTNCSMCAKSIEIYVYNMLKQIVIIHSCRGIKINFCQWRNLCNGSVLQTMNSTTFYNFQLDVGNWYLQEIGTLRRDFAIFLNKIVIKVKRGKKYWYQSDI